MYIQVSTVSDSLAKRFAWCNATRLCVLYPSVWWQMAVYELRGQIPNTLPMEGCHLLLAAPSRLPMRRVSAQPNESVCRPLGQLTKVVGMCQGTEVGSGHRHAMEGWTLPIWQDKMINIQTMPWTLKRPCWCSSCRCLMGSSLSLRNIYFSKVNCSWKSFCC